MLTRYPRLVRPTSNSLRRRNLRIALTGSKSEICNASVNNHQNAFEAWPNLRHDQQHLNHKARQRCVSKGLWKRTVWNALFNWVQTKCHQPLRQAVLWKVGDSTYLPSQLLPLNPGRQEHLYELPSSSHEPPFLHGLGIHLLKTVDMSKQSRFNWVQSYHDHSSYMLSLKVCMKKYFSITQMALVKPTKLFHGRKKNLKENTQFLASCITFAHEPSPPTTANCCTMHT